MNNKKIKKILIIGLIILFVLMSVTSSILACDTLHTDNCNIPNCSFCMLINTATYISQNIVLMAIYILTIAINLIIVSKTIERLKTNNKTTLVEMNVMLIE